ncbi:MAG TPA: DUF4886 domain-containing protein [Anaerolineales bacterium]|nr:DUF4886 domain-containing protein [Anaerolineales bacterium]
MDEQLKRYRVLRFRVLLLGLIVLAAGVLLVAVIKPSHSFIRLASPSFRILLIGNSFTSYNGGLGKVLQGLDPTIEAQEAAYGGYTLKDHWEKGAALQLIRGSKWDYVVLQEQSQTPVGDPALFTEYAARLGSEIKTAGAQPMLFMTWQYPESLVNGVTTRHLADAYFRAGSRLGAKVAPAGLAFAQALAEKPAMSLNAGDGHPTPQGTYLAACVLYATIMGRSPVGIAYAPSAVSKDERDFLQRVAAEVMGY